MKNLPADIILDQAQTEAITSIQNILSSYSNAKKFSNLFKNKNIKQGIYLQGSVGSGKTMLMEALYQTLQGKKLLIHYQDFIQTLHQNLHSAKLLKESSAFWDKAFEILNVFSQNHKNILGQIAKNYAKLTNYIFLDEFEIKDITDAMIIGPLFTEFINNNIFIFLTTNSLPDDLYKDGLQRESFLPFIDMIKNEFEVITLNSSDYRISNNNISQGKIFFPINSKNQARISDIIDELTDHNFKTQDLNIFGRKITFQSTHDDILVTDFDELFMQDFSYIDYIHVAQNFKTIIIKSMPVIDPANTNLAVRFINFIDNIYFYKVTLFMNMAASIEKLYENGSRNMEFKRAISRVREMSNE